MTGTADNRNLIITETEKHLLAIVTYPKTTIEVPQNKCRSRRYIVQDSCITDLAIADT